MFDENEHPRADDGKFTDKDGGKKGYDSRDDLGGIRNAKEETTPKKGKSKAEFFGEEFKGFKGGDAVEKLLKEKRGHIKNAFERPEIGGIDLVWGDDSGGLGHTIIRRDKQLEDGTGNTSGIEMARKIPEIIEKGNFSLGAGERPNITYNGYLVVIRPAFDGEKVNWVVTAMEPQSNHQNKKV